MSAVSTIVGAAKGPFLNARGNFPSASQSLQQFQQQAIESHQIEAANDTNVSAKPQPVVDVKA